MKSTDIVTVFRRNLEVMKDRLSDLEKEAKEFGADPDWPWNGFILSFSTFGGSDNWDKRIKRRRAEFAWKAVLALDNEARKVLFHSLPNPRFRTKIEEAVEAAFQHIKTAGGPAAVRAEYEKLKTSDERIKFFRAFKGIGEKYARNIPMDAHDPLVRDHYALDHRLKAILVTLTGQNLGYRAGEVYLGHIARELGVDGWTFDRILYGRYKEIMADLDALRNRALETA